MRGHKLSEITFRAHINTNLARQMKILTGAENLYRATTNCKVRETVALELNFVEASVDLLKEELIELNGTIQGEERLPLNFFFTLKYLRIPV